MPVLETLADQAADGCLVKPLFYQWVMDPSIPIDFTFRVQRPMQRKPDGRFHASSHPLMTSKELYASLAHPERHVPEAMGYPALMAVMFGTLAHAVMERFLDYMGVAVPLPEGDCPSCGRPYLPKGRRQTKDFKYCVEHGFAHPATLSSCHLDSILDFGDGPVGFDFKSLYPMGFKATKNQAAIRDMDADQFKEKWPHYWAQMQECMRMSGLREYIVFFLTMGSPWETREFHFPFDPEFAYKTEQKYLRVIDHVARGVPIVA